MELTFRRPAKYCILGPYPESDNYSIARYFNFYRKGLPELLENNVDSCCPGEIGTIDSAQLPQVSRTRAWVDNYVKWPLRLRNSKSECFHIVDQGLMWYSQFLCRSRRLGTVHDLIAHLICHGKLPFAAPPLKRRPIIWENTRQLLRLDHIISVSEHTASCLVRELSIPAARITVVPNHVDDSFYPLTDEERRLARTKWFGDAEYVVIHVGKASVYKNRLGAIKAFSLLRKQIPSARMFLVHGAPTAQELSCIREKQCRESIKFLPACGAAELREFYGCADVLIFPSLYEGFGWPPLEAMASGCPVVTTTAASLREVVGDAGLTVDGPHDHQRMAELLRSVLKDRATRDNLRQRGLDRAKLFSPERALRTVAELYKQVA